MAIVIVTDIHPIVIRGESTLNTSEIIRVTIPPFSSKDLFAMYSSIFQNFSACHLLPCIFHTF